MSEGGKQRTRSISPPPVVDCTTGRTLHARLEKRKVEGPGLLWLKHAMLLLLMPLMLYMHTVMLLDKRSVGDGNGVLEPDPSRAGLDT